MLIYNDQRARLWDTQTKELWRSMGLEKAEELITQGGWSDLYVVHLTGLPFSSFPHCAYEEYLKEVPESQKLFGHPSQIIPMQVRFF